MLKSKFCPLVQAHIVSGRIAQGIYTRIYQCMKRKDFSFCEASAGDLSRLYWKKMVESEGESAFNKNTVRKCGLEMLAVNLSVYEF